MKIALVVIGRLENRYAIEFIEYYKQLGFDHIYIIDNNHDGEENFEDVLQQYINNKFVSIFNYRNKDAIQMISYKETFEKIKNDYDWVAFFDFDEFLTLNKDKNIKDYLSRDCFKDANQILINWKIYSDNNLIIDDGRNCLERFNKPSNKSLNDNRHVKPIIRTNVNDKLLGNDPHSYSNEEFYDKTCNNIGEEIRVNNNIDINYNLAYLKHFRTKTIDEYIKYKYVRGTSDIPYNYFITMFNINDFFKYNEITEEKINFLKMHNFN